MSRKQSIAVAAVVAIVAIAAGMLLAQKLLKPGNAQLALTKATLLDPPRALPTFSLIDQNSAAFDAGRLKGHWSLMFFGFTRCPDVCPTTLGILAQTERSLANLPEDLRPHIVLVSVDPKRDTPEQLASYVKFFSPSFTGVTGSQQDIDEFTRALGVPVGTSELPNGDYTVDHSAAIFLVNPAGQLRALFSTPHVATTIADDYRRIVETANTAS